MEKMIKNLRFHEFDLFLQPGRSQNAAIYS